jgi:hypothetical protein
MNGITRVDCTIVGGISVYAGYAFAGLLSGEWPDADIATGLVVLAFVAIARAIDIAELRREERRRP